MAGKRPRILSADICTRVYEWENDYVCPFFANTLALDECEGLVRQVWRQHKWRRPPVVKDGRGSANARANRQVIHLPRWARTFPIVMHETAHSIVDDYEGISDQNLHGQQWLRWYIYLLVRYCDMEQGILVESANWYGLET